MNHFGSLECLVDEDVIEKGYAINPRALVAHLFKWTLFCRALEKLTECEAHMVISTVVDEKGFEEWW